jgi:hypothetical protein
MATRASLVTLFWLALGCSATATNNPLLSDGEDGGSSGTGTANAAGAGTPGGAPGASGASSEGGAHPAAGAPSVAGAGGAALGSGGSSVATAGAGGSGNTGPVTVGLPFTEDFESGMISPSLWTAVADQAPDPTNADWSVVADDTGKAAQLNSDGTARLLVGGNSAWTDQKIDLRLQIVSGSPEINVAFRYSALKQYYYLELENSHFKVRDRTGANTDLVPTGTKPAITAGNWYTISLQIKGTAVSASLDGAVVASGTFASTPIAAGGIAIGVSSGTGVVMFDDIHVSAP